ncbi:hypothetical protein [Hydrogenivirga sp.]
MELKEKVKEIDVFVEPQLAERVRREGKALVLYPTLKFSCLIAKRFKAEIGDPPGEGIHLRVGDIDVYVVFRAIGSRFCGGDKGFEDVDFPVREPERFLPRWIKVNRDLSGEFGYL